MANNMTNIVRFHGDAKVLDTIRHLYLINDEEKGGALDFEKILPIPADIAQNDSKVREWCRRHWGDARNSYWGRIVQEPSPEAPELVIRFTTAWNEPDGIFEALVKQVPGLVFSAFCIDEDSSTATVFRMDPSFEEGDQDIGESSISSEEIDIDYESQGFIEVYCEFFGVDPVDPRAEELEAA